VDESSRVTGQETVLIIDDDAARAAAAAAALAGDFRCVVSGISDGVWRGGTPAGRATGAEAACVDIVLVSGRVRGTIKNGGGALTRIVLAGADEAELAVQAIEAGASDAIVCGPHWLDTLPLRVRMSLARTAREQQKERQRQAVAVSLTRSRQKNRRLRSMVDWLQAAAVTDPLTNLANRRGLNDRLGASFNTAMRYGTELSVLVIDVDNLKAVNDTLGHAAGDVVLATAGRVIRGQSRLSDVGARVGGDEFVVLLPHTGAQQAGLLAARIQRAFEDEVSAVRISLGAASGGGSAAAIGLSVGIASARAGGAGTGEELLEQADLALYQAKRAGKGRVEISVRRAAAPEIKAA
jgi:diguanylate cyclase (GGDEF)-like protein